MGIGVFINHENITYTEIMKRLADEQKLYMIIASSDYIYGTNYQFCHGFLSKDLNLTQEKVIPKASVTVPAKKSTITCVKGKTSKKVTAVKPVCPKGYKKKV